MEGHRQPIDPVTTPRSRPMDSTRPGKITKTDEEWRKLLTPEQYRVTRQHGTEPAFSHAQSRKARRHVQVRVLRCAAVCVGCQIRFRHWLAQLLGAGRGGRGE